MGILFLGNVQAGKILFFIPFSSKSVKITFTPVLEKLAERGHEIVVVMPFDEKTDKYTVINSDPDGNILKLIDSATTPVLQKTNPSVLNVMSSIKNGALDLSDNTLKNPLMQKMIKDPNTKFDIIIIQPFLGAEAGFYLAHKFKAPSAIYFTAQSNMPFISHAIGQPFNPSFQQFPMLAYSGEMNFVQRALNTFATFMFEHVFMNIIIHNGVEALLDKHFPGEIRPSIMEMQRNVSLAMSFGHPLILDGWSPMLPNYVQLGMMNCRPGKAFPPQDEIGQFLANSKNGVVYVSFGSVIRGSLMTPQNQRILLKVFGRFPQYDFLWKWDQDTMDGKPDNVLLSKWLPQQDVLAHPKLKVFVTHAGQSSFQETLCHQKPVVAIPVTGDQPINAKEAERLGIGISHPYLEMNEKKLFEDLDKVLHDPKYLENAQKMGSIMNDQINRPLDRAIWWIEHIMKNPTVYQRKSPVHNLYWFQYFLLDVIALYSFVIYVVFKIIYKVFRLCCNKRPKEKFE